MITVLVLIIICGAIFSLSLVMFPVWEALVLKHVLRLIDALGVLLAWAFGGAIVYFVFDWLRAYW
jgi:hypothetical protein